MFLGQVMNIRVPINYKRDETFKLSRPDNSNTNKTGGSK